MKIGGGLLLVMYCIVRGFLIKYKDLEGVRMIVDLLGLFVILKCNFWLFILKKNYFFFVLL